MAVMLAGMSFDIGIVLVLGAEAAGVEAARDVWSLGSLRFGSWRVGVGFLGC